VLGGCATSMDVKLNPTAHPIQDGSKVYLVFLGDKSVDVDNSLQKAFLGEGFQVSGGKEDAMTDDSDLLVRYTDNWRWDLVMYLLSLELQLYDAKSKNLLSITTWKNSALHGFPNLDEVTKQLVKETVQKLKGAPQ
jgi:hypothetical protein